MANIAAGNVSYSVASPRRKTEANEKLNKVSVSFGNGVLTYPAGGVPLTGVGLGLPNVVTSVLIDDSASGSGFVYKHDATNNKIRIYGQDGSTGALVEAAAGVFAPAATTLVVQAVGW